MTPTLPLDYDSLHGGNNAQSIIPFATKSMANF